MLQRLRPVVIRNARLSSLEGGGEPGTAAVEKAESSAGQPPDQLALHDQSQVRPGLLMEEDEGEEVRAEVDSGQLVLPANIVQYQGVTLNIATRQQKTIDKLLEVNKLVSNFHIYSLTFFIFWSPSILLALLRKTCLGM